MKKVKADAKKGMAEFGKAAAHLRADAKADVEKLKANLVHDDGGNARAEVTRVPVTGNNTESRSISGEKVDPKKASEAVELVFGINAGIIWESLNKKGPMTVNDLVKATDLLPEEIYGALGWLGRENKISVEKQGIVRIFSLKP